MDTTPPAVREYINRSLLQERSPAYLAVLRDGRLAERGGSLREYGLEGLRDGCRLEDEAPFLQGYLPLEGSFLVLPDVEIHPGVTADIHLFPGPDADWVLLLNAADETRRSRGLQQALRDRQRELGAIQRLTRALASTTDESSLVKAALRVGIGLIGAEAGAVLLSDADSGELTYRYVEGFGGDDLVGQSVREGAPVEVYSSGRAQVLDAVTADTKQAAPSIDQTASAAPNMITLALVAPDGRSSGVMQLLNKRTGPIHESDVRLLEILSAEVALAVEQSRLYREAKVAEVARLLGDISHDIKNLLTPVVFGVDVLKAMIADLYSRLGGAEGGGGDSLPSEIGGYPRGFDAETVAMMQEAARRMQDRVKEIADCVKGVTSPLVPAPCQVNDLVERVGNVLRPVAEQDSISLATELAKDLPLVQADSGRLYSMLYNLMDNAMSAIRSTNRPGRVTIATAAELNGTFPEGNFLSIEVTDTGCGMTPETQARLFTSAMRSTTALGTGLGTKIIKDVVDAHGGEITVNSTVDVGTTFRVKLPLSRS